MAASTQKGPLASANNLTGFNWIAVTLATNTAKTWTHNFNSVPALMLPFDQTTGALNTVTSVTSNANAITLNSNANATINLLVCWKNTLELSSIANGTPATNFA